MAAISLKDISFSYSGGGELFSGFTLDINEGEITVIAGLSGCGKTTLCNIMSGIIPKAIKGNLSGSVTVSGEDISVKPLYEVARSVGLVFQDSDEQIVCTTVEDELAFGLENLSVCPDEIRRRVDTMAADMALSQFLLKNPMALSGGERKRVAIASVLILEPDVMIFDEPMSNLDDEGRCDVKNAVMDLKKRGKTVIIVEHDLSLATCADRWVVIEGGEIVLDDSPAELLKEPSPLRGLNMLFD